MKSKKLYYDSAEIGAKCKALRLELGESQLTVARETGTKQSAVSMFESGKMLSSRILFWYVKRGVKL